jgi:hypothetical protein
MMSQITSAGQDVLQEIGISPVEHGTSEESKYKQILGLKLVHLLAVFVLVYVGTEVTVGGKVFFLLLWEQLHSGTI